MEANNKVCRACLTTKESFTYYFFKNVESELYAFCTSIEIVKDDTFPKSICTVCYEQLLKFSDFKHACIKSQNHLLNYNHDWNVKNESENVLDNASEVKVECGFNDDDDMLENDDIPIIADVSNKQSTTGKEKCALRSKIVRKRPFLYKCTVCNKKYRLAQRFELHKLEHEGKTSSIQCDPCKKTFQTWSGLKRHEDLAHVIKNVKCTICNKVYKNEASLYSHMYSHEKRNVLVCDVCGKECSSAALKGHLETHKADRTRDHVCEQCPKRFFTSSALGNHVARSHGNRKFICHVCDYPFAEKYTLAKHLLIHQGLKLHKCDICQKAYSTQNILNEHKRIHSGEKPFSCSYCKKCFISKKRLRDHIRTHTGERPHKCTLCPLAFTQRGTLIRHLRIVHSNDSGILGL